VKRSKRKEKKRDEIIKNELRSERNLSSPLSHFLTIRSIYVSGDSCSNYIKSKFLNENHPHQLSLKKQISNNVVGHSNSIDAGNNQINDHCGWKCTEVLLEPLFQFVILSDRFLIPLLLPPSPFNSSLSHTLR
jgi:hypothetical protein